MNRLLLTAALLFTFCALPQSAVAQMEVEFGGTGNGTLPTIGQVLVGQSNGTYAPQATGTLGLGSGTVTSVGLTVPTGLSVSGSPVTTSGTLTVSYASGYSPVLTASTTNWQTAFLWGNHATAGYLTAISTSTVRGMLSASSPLSYDPSTGAFSFSNPGYITAESDPVFSGSAAFGISGPNITAWNAAAASTTALSNSYIRGLFSGSSPIGYNAGTGAISLNTAGDWTGTLDGFEASAFEQGLTAGDGLTRTLNDFDCDVASGSALGCLSAANWTTFNNKISSTSLSVLDTSTLDLGYTSSTGVFTGSVIANSITSTQLADDIAVTSYTATNGTTTNATTTGAHNIGGLLTLPLLGTSTGALLAVDPAGRVIASSTARTVKGAPQVTYYTSGSGTYTTPAGALYLTVELRGPGSGGSGSGTSPGAVSSSTSNTTFGSLIGGMAGAPSGVTPGIGGSATGGDINIPGQSGGPAANGYTFHPGGKGGGIGGGLSTASANGGSAVPNSGGGGAGGGADSTASPGAGGGEGGYVKATIPNPAASYSYNVGPVSTGGTPGTGGRAGSNSAGGYIIVTAHFQ